MRSIARRSRTQKTENPEVHQKLVLTPKQSAAGTFLDVTGDVELLHEQEGVMLNSSTEGIAARYILTQIPISLVLDPRLLVAA
jgi:hypothetical protein